MLEPGGRLQAILRNNGQSGDLVDTSGPTGFELVCVTWGAGRHDPASQRGGRRAQKGIDVASPPTRRSRPLQLGGPGSGSSPRFRGDVAEIRVYDRQLSDAERRQVEAELRDHLVRACRPENVPPRDPLAELYEELLSPGGPFWLSGSGAPATAARRGQAGLTRMRAGAGRAAEEAPAEDPPGRRGAGRRARGDAPRGLQGRPGLICAAIPRGPARPCRAASRASWQGERQRARSPKGSGRLQLADWLARPRQPADGPRHGQPDLAAPLRRGPGPHAQRFRRARRTADAPGIARLPGRALRGVGMVGEGDAPAHHAVVGLSAEQPSPTPPRPGRATRTTACSAG